MSHIPAAFSLAQNYPNPFNPSTEIRYDLPVSAHVSLRVYNVLGEEVSTLVDADELAGTHIARWEGRDASGAPVASGIYFCRLEASGTGERNFHDARKMLLVR